MLAGEKGLEVPAMIKNEALLSPIRVRCSILHRQWRRKNEASKSKNAGYGDTGTM